MHDTNTDIFCKSGRNCEKKIHKIFFVVRIRPVRAMTMVWVSKYMSKWILYGWSLWITDDDGGFIKKKKKKFGIKSSVVSFFYAYTEKN